MDELSRILIVDDERQNIKVLGEFLSKDYKIMASKCCFWLKHQKP